MPDYLAATKQAKQKAETNAPLASSNRDWVFRNLELIEQALAGKDTYQSYSQWLNDEHDFRISESVFANYLSDARKARNTTQNKTTRRKRKTATTTPTPNPSPKNKTLSSTQPDHQDDWNETEKFVEYRLEDCIRDFVYLKNGCVMTTFPKGTIFTAEIRAAFNRLQLTADQFSYKLKK